MATVHVSIFFYGLIALVDRPPDNMYLLLVENDMHTPFVAYRGGPGSTFTKPRPCADKLKPQDFNGCSTLVHEDISIPHFTTRNNETGISAKGQRRPGSPSPHDPNEAEDFAWVPRMADVLGIDLEFDDTFLGPRPNTNANSRGSRPTLAARIDLKSPPLSTCSLTFYNNPPNCPRAQAGIYEYSFIPRTAHTETVQTLTELLVVKEDIDNLSSLHIATTSFVDGTPGPSAKIAPYRCAAHSADWCIDVLIGNAPPKMDCKQTDKGADFASYYGLLKTPPIVHPLPIANGTVISSSLEPQCAAPGPDTSLHILLDSIDSRPVCAMVVF